MTHRKRPVTFKDWRDLQQQMARDVGFYVYARWACRGQCGMDRWLWYLLHRMRRIDARLEVEIKVRDATYYDCLRQFLDELTQGE